MEIKQAKIAIATHYLTYGPSQALREYLWQEKNNVLLFLAHPLAGSNKEDRSYFELIENGLIKIKKTAGRRSQSFFWNCLAELFLSIKWLMANRQKYDLFVGVDNWNCLAGLFLKRLGLTKKVVYYVIDYFPKRFDNRLLNLFYYQLDKFCVKYADETWNLSPNMAEAREKFHGMSKERYNRQKVVPIGVWFDTIVRQDFSQVKKHQAVFVGHLLEMMGVQLAIRAIPLIIKKIPDFHFLVIGGGEYEAALKNLAKEIGVESQITFTGWIKDRQERDRLMADSAVGLATFNTDILDEKVKNADPAKIKDYLVLGLPVILTNAPSNAYDLQDNGCGLVVGYQAASLVDALVEMLLNEQKLAQYRVNALRYIKQYNWPVIFDFNLKRVLNIL